MVNSIYKALICQTNLDSRSFDLAPYFALKDGLRRASRTGFAGMTGRLLTEMTVIF
jgi:hypothetical protein